MNFRNVIGTSEPDLRIPRIQVPSFSALILTIEYVIVKPSSLFESSNHVSLKILGPLKKRPKQALQGLEDEVDWWKNMRLNIDS